MEMTISELEQAINHWRLLRPSTGEERSLSAEVNTLANVYAMMIFTRSNSIDLNTIDPAAQALIDTWRAQQARASA